MTFKDKLEKQAVALTKPDMLINIIKEVQKEGVVGEEDAILALLLKFTMRLVINSEPTSSNIVLSDESGGGKDNIVKAMGKVLIKEDCYMHRNGLSPKVFTYWHSNEKDWTWTGKVLHIEDPEEDLINCQGFKTMASGHPSKVVVKDQKAVEYTSTGKPVLIVTSRESHIAMEGIRRWDAIQMDTSDELSKAIVKYICEKQMGIGIEEPDNDIKSALQHLAPRNVTIPFAGEIINCFPYTVQARTQIHKFLDYIKASTVLHQYQREVNEDHYLIAEMPDLIFAWFAYEKFGNKFGIPLNKDEVDFMTILIDAKRPLRVSDILHRFSRGRDWIYRHLDKLKSVYLIQEDVEFDEPTHREVLTIIANENLYKIDRVGNKAVSKIQIGFSTMIRKRLSSEKKDEKSSCRTFLGNVRILDTYRKANNLSPKFDEFLLQLEELGETYSTTTKLTTTTKEKEEPKVVSQESAISTRDDQKRLDLYEEVLDLHHFIENNYSLGTPTTKQLLYDNFSKEFIDENIKRGLLVKKGDSYETKG